MTPNLYAVASQTPHPEPTQVAPEPPAGWEQMVAEHLEWRAVNGPQKAK